MVAPLNRRAAVIGSGPNGLTAAVMLARAGLDVEVFEAAPDVGGGTRTEELTLAGFRHDVCSAIHPLARVSPAFRDLRLELDWVESPAACAHPFEDGTTVTQAVLTLGLASFGRAVRCSSGERWR